MSPRSNPPLPQHPFGLLLVEGGDERALCEAVAGSVVWAGLFCWKATGRDALKELATLAKLDTGFSHARSVGVVLDIESNLEDAERIAQEVLAVFGPPPPFVHGVVSGQPLRLGAFLLPDGRTPGCLENLCRQAVRSPHVAACVDSLVICSQVRNPTEAMAAKGWLQAYLAMQPTPQRLHDAFKSQRGGIDASHVALDPLRSFLRAL